MAGVSRLQYTTETRLIRVMCSGRVDPEFIFKAFANGVDGVFIGGCRLNECNYITQGNYHVLNMVLLCRKIMEHIGLNPKRLRVEFMSAGEGNIFTEDVGDFGRQIKELGPLGKGEGEDLGQAELKTRLAEIRKLVPYIKMAVKEKLRVHLKDPAEYEAYYTLAEVEKLLAEVPAYYIDPEKCQACMICQRKCPVEAIDGRKKQIHVIDQDKCIKCRTCFESCPPRFGAIKELIGEPVPPPIPEEERMLAKK